VRSKVSRFTFKLSTGEPACVRCLKRPQRWDGTRWQSYCRVCHTDYMRQRRVARTEMLLDDHERGQVLEFRQRRKEGLAVELRVVAIGKHRAAP
jgi:hypothetical protein